MTPVDRQAARIAIACELAGVDEQDVSQTLLERARADAEAFERFMEHLLRPPSCKLRTWRRK